MEPSDQSSHQFEEDLYVIANDRKEILRLHWCIWKKKLHQTHPDMGQITILITLGEMLLWFVYPPELQKNWIALAILWATSWSTAIAITTSRKHWIKLFRVFAKPQSHIINATLSELEKTRPQAHWLGED